MSMRRARAGANQQRFTRGVRKQSERPVPLPVKGLFVEAEEAEMQPGYAGRMHNWRSESVHLELRPQAAVTRGTGALQEYLYDFGERRLIRLKPDSAAAHGINGERHETLLRTFNGSAALTELSSTLMIVDGLGKPVRYSASGFSEATFTTSTGVDPNTFDGCVAHHDRVYFWKIGGALEFYYGDVGATQGALTRFPLDRLGSIRGSIVAMRSLTLDAGHGINDVLAIMTSAGQTIIYEGLDPGDARDWRLSTRIQSSPPIGQFAFEQIGSDLWFLTAAGLVSTRLVISQGTLSLANPVTRPISRDVLDQIELGGFWQLHLTADAEMVLLNWHDGETAKQWVFYSRSETWATTDYPACWWHNVDRETRFNRLDGRGGTLVRSSGDELITAVMHTAWIRIGKFASITTITPTILAEGALDVKLTVLSDHDTTEEDIAEAEQTVHVEPDTPGGRVALNEEFSCDAVGSVFQLRIEITAKWAKLVSLTASGS